jgi:hypothetical protein
MKSFVHPHVQCQLTSQQIHVTWDPDPPDFSSEVAAYIEDRWGAYEASARVRHISFFNAPITRLLKFDATADSLHLTLGPADYKSFLISCLRDHAWFTQHAPGQIVRGLGNTVLLTTQTHAIFGVRSASVATYAGRAHLIGGVVDALDTPTYPASTAGLIAHLTTELREEVSLDPADLAPHPTLLGIFEDAALHQPELLWHWPLRISLDTLRARLVNVAEHDRLLLLDRAATPVDLADLTPLARAGWERWRIMP